MIIKKATTAPLIRPQYNLGGIFDVITGTFIEGAYGSMYCNGGLSFINSVIGTKNSFKTALAMAMLLTVLSRYKGSSLVVYDTESSFTYTRLQAICARYPQLSHIDFNDLSAADVIQIIQSADLLGDEFFELIKELANERAKDKNIDMKTTPFMNFGNEPIKLPTLIQVLIDSLSQWKATSVESKIVDAAAVGESKTNTQFMREAAAKSQMITQMPNVSVKGGMLFMMVAHTGLKMELDQYAPKQAALAHSKRGTVAKGVTEKFEYLNNNLWEIHKAEPFINSSADRSARYPLTAGDRDINTVDLMKVLAVQTRNKNGVSGFRFNLAFSQTQGYQSDVTMFDYLRSERDRFGFEGNDRNYELILLPGVKLSRTTFREKSKADPRLLKALELTTQLCQIIYHTECDAKYHIDPAELYEGIKRRGYSWDEILLTRSYWTYLEDEKNHPPHCSIWDVLRMYTGEYEPYWLKDQYKDKFDPNWLEAA